MSEINFDSPPPVEKEKQQNASTRASIGFLERWDKEFRKSQDNENMGNARLTYTATGGLLGTILTANPLIGVGVGAAMYGAIFLGEAGYAGIVAGVKEVKAKLAQNKKSGNL